MIMAFSNSDLMQDLSEDSFSGIGGFFIGIIYLIMSFVYAVPCYYLLKSSNQIKQSVELEDSQVLQEGLKNQASVFTFFGVVTLIMLCLYFLIFIFAIFAASLASGF